MQQFKISKNEAGQRLDKFLHKYMPLAPSSFFYKMLRKKNITLNGKKAEGKEKLSPGDEITFYLSDETIKNFQAMGTDTKEYEEAYHDLKGISVIYEDEHIVILNKPSGILSQKAGEGDLSINEWLVGYLLHTKALTADGCALFRPSICNRLDRNTMGLMIGAKSLAGSQEINRLQKERRIRKFYRMFVKGQVPCEKVLEGYLVKDGETNQVHLVEKGVGRIPGEGAVDGNMPLGAPANGEKSPGEKVSFIRTRYYPIKQFSDRTLAEAELLTGKSHQLRIHMASEGHPLLGDYKYGDKDWNNKYRAQYHITSQLLYACRLEFPVIEGALQGVSGKKFTAPAPLAFERLQRIP